MSCANLVLLGCSGPRVFLPLNETHLCINRTTGNTKGCMCIYGQQPAYYHKCGLVTGLIDFAWSVVTVWL